MNPTRSTAINAANTSYSSLLKKVISNLILRSLLMFFAALVASYFLFHEAFDSISQQSPYLYLYIFIFSTIYLAIQLFLTAYVMKCQVILPLKHFIDAAQQLVSGSKDVKFDIVRSSEFLNLNESIKFIKLELTEKDKRIESYQKSLEQLIDERTADLKQALKVAESTTQSKTEFFSNITHDLRTPLNGILGMADLMMDSGLTLEQKGYLETMRESGNNLLSIVNDFLEFSKIEAGKISLFKESLNIRKLLNRSLMVLNIKAEQKGIIIVDKIEDNVPQFIVTDNLRLKQIIQNLVSNLIKFSNKCGAIMLWVGAESQTETTVKLHFTISDAGIGISQEKI